MRNLSTYAGIGPTCVGVRAAAMLRATHQRERRDRATEVTVAPEEQVDEERINALPYVQRVSHVILRLQFETAFANRVLSAFTHIYEAHVD